MSKRGSVILICTAVEPDVVEHSSPPLGLLYVGAVLRQHRIPVQLFDLRRPDSPWSAVKEAIASAPHCLVGFSCYSDNIHSVIRLSDRLLSRHRGLRVVLGGPHVTHVWEPYVTPRRIVVRSEGEYPLLLLAKHFLQGKGELRDIPSIVYKPRSSARANPVCFGPYEDVDAVPFPDYSLLPARDSYLPAVITGRGCSQNCFFCSEGNRERGFRPRSVCNVEQELMALKAYYGGKVPYLTFSDDTFTSSPSRVEEMCDMLDRVFPNKSCFGFFCEGRVSILGERPDLIHRLRGAGMVRLQIGIESGDQTMLDRINKKTRVTQIEKVVAACDDADVPSVYGAFICGLPGQTERQVEKEIEFAKHLVDLAPGRIELSMVPLVLLPGTEFRANAARWGLSVLDGDFATARFGRRALSESSDLSKDQIDLLCQRFESEVRHHWLDSASWLSPRSIKELIARTADLHASTRLVETLTRFSHIARTVRLRRRTDYRFLSELPDGLALEETLP